MKKLLAIFMTIAIALACTNVFADGIDFDQYDDTSLISLLQDVQQEIANRKIEKSATLAIGSYIVGKDIPVGSYKITVDFKGTSYMDVYVYPDGGDGDLKADFTVFEKGKYGSDGTGEFFINLEAGDLLRCTGEITLTIQAGVKFQ